MSDRSEKVKDGLPIRTEEILRDVELRTADSCTHDPMGREGNERPSYGTTFRAATEIRRMFGKIGAHIALRSDVCCRDHHTSGQSRGSVLLGMAAAWGDVGRVQKL
jgi:hypothetical protein